MPKLASMLLTTVLEPKRDVDGARNTFDLHAREVDRFEVLMISHCSATRLGLGATR